MAEVVVMSVDAVGVEVDLVEVAFPFGVFAAFIVSLSPPPYEFFLLLFLVTSSSGAKRAKIVSYCMPRHTKDVGERENGSQTVNT